MNEQLDDVSRLKSLGTNQTDYRYQNPSPEMLETFPNRHPDAKYQVDLVFPEFTSLCPKTGQPDFARIEVTYIPKDLCLESKAVKLYFFAYRNFGAFMESITNKILRDFVAAASPRWMRVRGVFAPRGALAITVNAEYSEAQGFRVMSIAKEA